MKNYPHCVSFAAAYLAHAVPHIGAKKSPLALGRTIARRDDDRLALFREQHAADRLRPLVGQLFEAQVSGVSDSGTYVRLVDGTAEGRVVRGYRTLTVGMQVPVRLVATDSVHGFIDFEYVTAADAAKDARLERKRAAAALLEHRVGEAFDAVVTGTTRKATWIVVQPGDVEGRLVRGRHGLIVGSSVRVVLLTADPIRGFIDFAADDRP